jgi:peptidoglycan hydrolase-like protein with peptidoglycan-binding domain
MSEGVDYSFSRPGGAALAGAGKQFALRYLWYNTASKGISGGEWNDLVGHGLAVGLLYEEDGLEFQGGQAAGIVCAKKAESYRTANGLPAQPIFFCVDTDTSDYATVNAFCGGVASVIGHDRTGLYAGERVIKAAFDAGVIAYAFQTYAWSDGEWDPRAQVQQYSNGQNINGAVDLCRNVTNLFGASGARASSSATSNPLTGNITTRPTVDIQNALIAKGFSCGPTGADGMYGPATTAAVKAFQASVGITQDGIYGPITDQHLFGVPEGGTTPPPFPLPAGWYFGPKEGPQQSVSGYYSHSDDLKVWQQRMKDRGWNITVDGLYGPETESIAKQFQAEKGLVVDGLIGVNTWAAAWTAPITPAQ